MLVNDRELIATSLKPGTIEGRINYKVVQRGKSKSSFKEFWFKLTGNLLFYFTLNNFGGIKGNVSSTLQLFDFAVIICFIFCPVGTSWSYGSRKSDCYS